MTDEQAVFKNQRFRVRGWRCRDVPDSGRSACTRCRYRVSFGFAAERGFTD
jgi:hypothetical protein